MSDKEKYGATDESPIIEPPPNDGTKSYDSVSKEGEGEEDAMALHEVYEKLGKSHSFVLVIPLDFQRFLQIR